MTLDQHIRTAYPNRTHTNPKTGHLTARIDDQTPADRCRGFCQITLTVAPDESFTLELRDPPLNEHVRQVLDNIQAIVEANPVTIVTLHFATTIMAGARAARVHASKVRFLAATIKTVTGRGQLYPDPNWKWMVPRTAKSLTQLAKVLTRAARTSGTKAKPATIRQPSPTHCSEVG